MMISKEEWAQRMLDAAKCIHGTIPPLEQLAAVTASLRAETMLEAAKIASEYHTFCGVRLGLLQRAKELQEGGR